MLESDEKNAGHQNYPKKDAPRQIGKQASQHKGFDRNGHPDHQRRFQNAVHLDWLSMLHNQKRALQPTSLSE